MRGTNINVTLSFTNDLALGSIHFLEVGVGRRNSGEGH